MTVDVLKTLLVDARACDYFVVETLEKDPRRAESDRHLIFLTLPTAIVRTIAENTIDTITYMQVKAIENAYIETNIYLHPKIPPFQNYCTPFRNAIHCVGFEFKSEDEYYIVSALLNSDVKTVAEFNEFITAARHKAT